MVDSRNAKENRNNTLYIILTVVVIVGLWGFNLYFLYDKVHKGILGDMFGPVNALFSGLALAGIIWAIVLQKRELKYQRQELKLTIEALEGQRKELELQNLSFKHQRIENTFFQLFKLQNDIIASFHCQEGHGRIITGRECFENYYKRIQHTLKLPEYLKDEEKFHLYLDNFFNKILFLYGHYFQGLNEMLKFVDDMDLQDKSVYIALIKAHLSKYELLLLFYYAITILADSSLKALIEKYSLFDKLLAGNLIHEDDSRYYNENAYKISS